MEITNNHNIPLPVAVWAIQNDYDQVTDPNYFSATTLLKSPSFLAAQKHDKNKTMDISDLIASRMGTAIHDSIEQSWSNERKRYLALLQLGINPTYAKSFLVNPDKVYEGDIPVYLEKRTIKSLGDYLIGGKFDMVLDGVVNDVKTTHPMNYQKNNSDLLYQMQGSIYKWLNPDIITDDYIQINFLFTSWQKSLVGTEGYPPARSAYKRIPLLSLQDTEIWIKNRINKIQQAFNTPVLELAPAHIDSLYKTEVTYKYYSDPTKTDGRSTKNFTSAQEAAEYRSLKQKGIVIPSYPTSFEQEYIDYVKAQYI